MAAEMKRLDEALAPAAHMASGLSSERWVSTIGYSI
jgi:hypothetical protein